MSDPIGDLERAIGHHFDDRSLIERALTHPSYASEQAERVRSNGRLEFLGDAVLGLVVSEELHDVWDMDEGLMTKARASVVNEEALFAMGASLGVPAALLLGRGEDADGGRSKPAIVADATEAVLAALFLDAGFDVTREVILRLWRPLIAERAQRPGERDHKSMLQELLAKRSLQAVYATEGSGPDHDRRFDAEVLVDGEVVGRGRGTSKQRAEAAAARDALGRLDDA